MTALTAGERTALRRCPYEMHVDRASSKRFRFYERLERVGLVVGRTSNAGYTTFFLTETGENAVQS